MFALVSLPSYLSQVSLRHARLVPPALDSAESPAALRSQLEPYRCLQQHCNLKSLRERARSPCLTEPQHEGSRLRLVWRQVLPIGLRRPRQNCRRLTSRLRVWTRCPRFVDSLTPFHHRPCCSHSPALEALPCSSPATPERAEDGEIGPTGTALILRWMNCAIGYDHPQWTWSIDERETRPAGNDAGIGGPKWTVDRTIFELWLGGL